jgi:hypothetical protein
MTIAFPRAIFQDAHLADKLSCGNRAKRESGFEPLVPLTTETLSEHLLRRPGLHTV